MSAPLEVGQIVQFPFFGGTHEAEVTHVYLVNASKNEWRFTGRSTVTGRMYAQINARKAVAA